MKRTMTPEDHLKTIQAIARHEGVSVEQMLRAVNENPLPSSTNYVPKYLEGIAYFLYNLDKVVGPRPVPEQRPTADPIPLPLQRQSQSKKALLPVMPRPTHTLQRPPTKGNNQ